MPQQLLNLRALKATSDDLARAREKLQAHGLELTPKKDTGRPSAPSAPAAPPTPHQPPALPDALQPSYPTLKDDAPEAWTAPSMHPTVDAYFRAQSAGGSPRNLALASD